MRGTLNNTHPEKRHEEPLMPTREEVFAAIVSEREYQDQRWGRTLDSLTAFPGQTGSSTLGQGVGNRSIDEFVLYIEGYARDLAQIASHTNDPREKLNFIRKVTALGVAAMEQHGAPLRDDGEGNFYRTTA
jgi:hypothetical protein